MHGHSIRSRVMEAMSMYQGFEFTWKSLAEASEDAARKFTWIAAGLFLACSVLAYVSISTHVRYSSTCEYIGVYASSLGQQQTREADFARALLNGHCG